jgi:hypothetical protein
MTHARLRRVLVAALAAASLLGFPALSSTPAFAGGQSASPYCQLANSAFGYGVVVFGTPNATAATTAASTLSQEVTALGRAVSVSKGTPRAQFAAAKTAYSAALSAARSAAGSPNATTTAMAVARTQAALAKLKLVGPYVFRTCAGLSVNVAGTWASDVSMAAVTSAAMNSMVVAQSDLVAAASEVPGMSIASFTPSTRVAKFHEVVAAGYTVNLCVTEPASTQGYPVSTGAC